jgi:hypothetical protein
MKTLARKALLTLAAAAMLAAALPMPAHAWGRVGVFVGISPFAIGIPAPGYDYPPPPPPPYYPPPYPPYAPPRPIGFTCYARPYECPLAHPKVLGRPCACAALNGGAIPGTVIQ